MNANHDEHGPVRTAKPNTPVSPQPEKREGPYKASWMGSGYSIVGPTDSFPVDESLYPATVREHMNAAYLAGQESTGDKLASLTNQLAEARAAQPEGDERLKAAELPEIPDFEAEWNAADEHWRITRDGVVMRDGLPAPKFLRRSDAEWAAQLARLAASKERDALLSALGSGEGGKDA